MSNLILGIPILVAIVVGLFFLITKDFSQEANKKFKKITLGALGVAAALSCALIGTAENTQESGKASKSPKEIKLEDEIKKKEGELALAIDKYNKIQAEANQAKAENELNTANVLKLQEDLLRKNDEYNLLKEELNIRYQVDADKLIKQNEDKIRKSAAAEAQRRMEQSQLQAKIKVAKDDIESQIVSKWTPPKDKHNLTVVAQYSMDDKGTLLTVELVQKSGSVEVDNSVIEAIRAASPFKVSSEEEVRKASLKQTSKFILP